ncbi:hypothetical protein KIMC2_06490 [Xylocopilactobacillus apis]|uniref:SAM-dependent MTase RsmB/NOP-type domain-containing protein n=1 Tax=Xylocopilactobacillus apis TaxID=2932183 RepID=A0AAU9D5J7_9LACO|nr:hypothetical protein KIMC2_06490 [Xylocopilactobacillus apis]
MVSQFLTKHLNFSLVNLSVNPQSEKESMLQIYPDDYLTDGFFIALMQKQEA